MVLLALLRARGRGLVIVMGLCGLLNGCGGGGGSGGDCQVTGSRADVVYTPSVPITGLAATDALTYRLNQRNTWSLQPRGMTAACLQGLNVRLRDAQFPLPAGFTLDAKTGTIDGGVMTKPLEGQCVKTVNGTTESGAMSVNRVCAAGYTLQDEVYALIVTSDHFNQTTLVPTAVIFQPAP